MRAALRSRPIQLLVVAFLACSILVPLASRPADAGPVGPRGGVEVRGDIVITANTEFTFERGVRSGSGTAEDPFVITGWEVPNVVVRDTSAHVVIRDNVIAGQLVLNWNGKHVKVHHNQIGDLRVNQNVERTGEATGGHMWANVIGSVGQLRHFGGEFNGNLIGSPEAVKNDPNVRAVNFDGFHRARFHNNTIFGYLDLKLHGHYHGSSYSGASHSHDGSYEVDEYGIPTDPHAGHEHMRRFHQVFITDNTIYSPHAWALRYYDTPHAADDRTANSEEDKFLNGPHVHFTKVHLTNNKLIGGALMIDVFNAQDDNHFGYAPGTINVRRNQIALERDVEELTNGRHGILVRQARYLTLNITGNRVTGPNVLADNDLVKIEREIYNGAGIRLDVLEEADVHIYDNRVANRKYGVHASNLPRSVHWWIDGLRVDNVKQDIYYDETVVRKPRSKN